MTTSSTAVASPSPPERRSSPRRRIGAISTARLFHTFVLLNGFGSSLLVFLWTKDHQTPLQATLNRQENNGTRGALKVDTSRRNKLSNDQVKRALNFLNQTVLSSTTTASATVTRSTINKTGTTPSFPSQQTISPARSGRLETIHRLEALGVNISMYTELLPFLPEWAEVVSQYGDGPKIHGLDTCQAYRENIPFYERIMAPTGLFNSGTNLLAFLMEDNCELSPGLQLYGGFQFERRGISWQPPWGKHNPMEARFSDYSINITKYASIPHQVVMPVVTVRHPLDWMNSTCRHRYALRFARWDEQDGKECPFIVAKPPDERLISVYVNYAFPGRFYYKSLAHLWNLWNRPYLDGVNYFGNRTFYSVSTNRTLSTPGTRAPSLMVRHEDLIFFPDQVVKQVCDCLGGNYLYHGLGFQLMLESAKFGMGHGASRTGFLDAWIKYGYNRSYANFDPLDKAKAIEFFDRQMLQTFHYQV